MPYNKVSDISFPEFYYGAMHHQSNGFLDGVIFGLLTRSGRR